MSPPPDRDRRSRTGKGSPTRPNRGQGRGPKRAPGRPNAHRGNTPQPPRLHTVYEDGSVLVLNKPVGLLTASADPTGEPTLFDLATRHLRRQGHKRTRLWIIHRLDQDASGLVVFAKTEQAAEHLREELKTHRVHRLFTAVVEGTFDAPGTPTGQPISGMIHAPIRESRDGGVHVVSDDDRRPDRLAKPAVTQYRVEKQTDTHALLKVRLKTGRKFQIRAHFASIGRPVAGDREFGASSNPIGRLVLHAGELGFVHPVTRESVRYMAPTPPEFSRLIDGGPAPRTGNKQRDPDLGDTSWQPVAEWYGEYQTSERSDHFAEVIEPGTLRLLGDVSGKRLLDVACGEGSFARLVADRGVSVVGVDAAGGLIEQANNRAIRGARFVEGDARAIGALNDPALADPFDAACCIMALMNIDPIGPVLGGVAAKLHPGAPFVAVILHPAFRSPKRTSWGWTDGPAAEQRQHRVVDAYLTPSADPIVMNPGRAASGEEPITTWTFHRPLESYVRAFAAAGLLIDAIEEWPSRRTSEPGPRAAEENRARKEIPMFMGIRGIRAGRTHPA